ncbi:MAG TPA: type I methionyl aminopeptidase [Candidatus Eisenbacteria bacterium]|jgi:methionyl aminopeptidase|nr:type I methionyl aminopeptidase [Candidatus Eisenbacteria bacterium]
MIYLRSEEEIALIRRSARIVSGCLDHLERMVAPGVTPSQLDREAERFVKDHGAQPAFKGYRGYPATLCVSVNHVVVHGIPNDVALEEGDIVGLDMGAIVEGFYADSARTVPVGAVPKEVQRLIDVTRESLHRGIAQAVDGHRVGDIGHAIQTYAEGFGFSVVRDLVGHGVGRQLHEEPQVPNYGRPGRGPKLAVGMVLAIEPMLAMGEPEVSTLPDNWTVVTRDRSWSAHFEHTIAVGRGTSEILSISDGDAEQAALHGRAQGARAVGG